ncbi:MAG TPA: hypothetical protein VM529_03115, partial [Gemmata sp.]|nr:hypothetical protein [Gemmata sp.]
AAYWALAGGSLQKFRVALIPSRGQQVVEAGPRVALGEPTQAAQVTRRRDAAFLVVRSLNSAEYKAVLLNLDTGELRWQRQLGLIPAAPPIRQDGTVVLAAEAGSLVAIPAGGVAAGRTTVAPPAWVVGLPPEQITGPTRVAVAPDGSSAYTVTPVAVTEDGKAVGKYVVRRVAGGRVAYEGVVTSPGAIAGNPVVLGNNLLIPASDGFVHRYTAGTGRTNPDAITPGPAWAGLTRAADAECFITPLSDSAFLTGDGGKKLESWAWPRGGGWSKGPGKWDLPVAVAGPGVLLPPRSPGEAARVLFADVGGTIRLYAADRGGDPLKLWRPGGETYPAGKPTSPPVTQPDAAGRPVVAVVIEDRIVLCIDPEKDAPLWVARTGEGPEAAIIGAPQPAGTGRWLLTNLGGEAVVYEANGNPGPKLPAALPGAVPARPAALVGPADVLAPLSDGSVVALSLPTEAPPPDAAPKK